MYTSRARTKARCILVGPGLRLGMLVGPGLGISRARTKARYTSRARTKARCILVGPGLRLGVY